jgi:hypothetical protein
VGSAARTGASAARGGASEVCAGASAARAASVVDCLVAGTSAPAPGDGPLATGAGSSYGVQAPTCRGEPAPYLLPLLPPLPRPTTSTPLSLARRVPAARTAGTPRSSAPGAPVAARCAPSCVPPALALAVAPRARVCGTEAWVGRISWRSQSPSAGVRRSLKMRRPPKKPAKKERKSRNPLTNWLAGSISNAHRDASSPRPGLRSMARRVRPREGIPQQS